MSVGLYEKVILSKLSGFNVYDLKIISSSVIFIPGIKLLVPSFTNHGCSREFLNRIKTSKITSFVTRKCVMCDKPGCDEGIACIKFFVITNQKMTDTTYLKFLPRVCCEKCITEKKELAKVCEYRHLFSVYPNDLYQAMQSTIKSLFRDSKKDLRQETLDSLDQVSRCCMYCSVNLDSIINDITREQNTSEENMMLDRERCVFLDSLINTGEFFNSVNMFALLESPERYLFLTGDNKEGNVVYRLLENLSVSMLIQEADPESVNLCIDMGDNFSFLELSFKNRRKVQRCVQKRALYCSEYCRSSFNNVLEMMKGYTYSEFGSKGGDNIFKEKEKYRIVTDETIMTHSNMLYAKMHYLVFLNKALKKKQYVDALYHNLLLYNNCSKILSSALLTFNILPNTSTFLCDFTDISERYCVHCNKDFKPPVVYGGVLKQSPSYGKKPLLPGCLAWINYFCKYNCVESLEKRYKEIIEHATENKMYFLF